MTSKRIIIIILGAFALTFICINMLAIPANHFTVNDGSIIFTLNTDEKIYLVIYSLLIILGWKVILPERDLDDLLFIGSYFLFFMMFLMGWFALDIPTSNFIATLSFFTAFIVGGTFSFVLMCTLGDVFAIAFSTKPKEKAKNNAA